MMFSIVQVANSKTKTTTKENCFVGPLIVLVYYI